MPQKENWRPVPSCPGLLASSLGRLMCSPVYRPSSRGGFRVYGGNPTYGTWNETDKRFQHVYNGKIKKVARLVCEAFHGPAPDGKPVCMHLDENSKNNKPENLRWGTQKENLNFPGFLRYCRSRTGDNNPRVRGMKP